MAILEYGPSAALHVKLLVYLILNQIIFVCEVFDQVVTDSIIETKIDVTRFADLEKNI